MPTNFEIAALDAEQAPRIEEQTAEITLGSKYVSLWRRPTPGQYAMFQLRLSRAGGDQQGRALDKFFGNLVLTPEEILAPGRVDEEGEAYAERIPALKQEAVGFDFIVELIENPRNNLDESFLLTLLEKAMEVHSGFPTSPASGSSTSPTPSGPPSTARSRRQGSTRSA